MTFKDSYDGGALGNVSIEILPSSTKTLETNSVPLLWNPDVDSLSSRVDTNFAKASISAGSADAAALTAHGWAAKQQGCQDFKNERRPARARLRRRPATPAAVPHRTAPTAPYGTGRVSRGPTVVSPASRSSTRDSSTTTPAYYLPVFPGIEAVDKLMTGTFNTPVEDPDEYVGPVANPFPYPAIDPDRLRRSDDRQQRA